MKAVIPIELSNESLRRAREQLQKFKEEYKNAIASIIRAATERAYNMVIDYCNQNNLSEYTGAIQWEFDEKASEGRIWVTSTGRGSAGLVIILNEMGTGIVGANNKHPHPSKAFQDWEYDVNEHGDIGWKYPKKDGTFGWTRGIKSKHMFYSAFQDICSEIGYIINVEMQKTIGDLYERRS